MTGIGWGENFPVLKTCITNITVEMEGFDYKFQFRRFFFSSSCIHSSDSTVSTEGRNKCIDHH